MRDLSRICSTLASVARVAAAELRYAARGMEQARTDPPSARKLARARRRGVVPKSTDLIASAALLALAGSLFWSGGHLLHALQTLLTRALAAAAQPQPPPAAWLGAQASEVAWLALE